ncbi:putative 2-aminoethylphosphonate ABC transporter ATP-binding protein [Photobacterium sp. BZF1]|uniref:putative 2-aminoethylphosphonate ABC transporter ATP-binding protein n=1 Tax=Photobacterium sp. BZF1 TaxID=1904457 RepID=UPI001653C699|nr:putative 2-aminoethylphosphonate ABC transporter ATP-binding protein [Photobacterium sp. BZF1]MBC7003080.1 putative 2-aminoethylphosphonate ABC transporter ATP-binding protein [Photobacterium sp. BZF1]
MSAQSYLSIGNVVKKFDQFTALNDISLTIEQGEFVCFLGPSGCGKTTLLRAIAGLELPTSGKIVQADKDITFLPPEQRDFGIVFQSYALFPNLTVADNISFALKEQGLSRQEVQAQLHKWLKIIDLPDSGNKYPSQLSGGQQQRVALARALVLQPGLLLLDEPLSALDAKVRTHLRSEIRRIQTELGITTIMVTHDQEEALSMADRIVVMNHGVIEQVGTPQEIYNHPASEFVARFVGSMNFIPQHHHILQSVTLPTIGQTAALRPENITLCHQQESNANIIACEFLGPIVRTTCYVDEELTLLVDLPSDHYSQLGLHIGSRVHVGFESDKIQLFMAEAA